MSPVMLNVSNNILSSLIPSTFINLTTTKSVELSSNKLVRNIPTQLANLTNFSWSCLSYTPSVGPTPEGSQIYEIFVTLNNHVRIFSTRLFEDTPTIQLEQNF